MTNPYQPVIDWLRSPEGEAWSEQRLAHDYWQPSVSDYQRTTYNVSGPAYLRGIFSVKEQC